MTAGSRLWRLVMTPSVSRSRISTPAHLACSFSIQLVPSCPGIGLDLNGHVLHCSFLFYPASFILHRGPRPQADVQEGSGLLFQAEIEPTTGLRGPWHPDWSGWHTACLVEAGSTGR